MAGTKKAGDTQPGDEGSGRWLRPELDGLPRYSAGTPARAGIGAPWHKLSSNESPFSPSAAVVSAIESAAREANRYPPVFGDDLALKLSRHHGLAPERVAVAGGSLVLLQQAVQAAASPGDEVLFAWRSYEAYPIIVETARCRAVTIPLHEYKPDLAALEKRISASTRIVIACSPNNPTGSDVSSEELERFLRATEGRCLVVLDEAYRDFSTAGDAPNGLELQERFDHLLVLRTFSKAHNLAGARVGWCAVSSRDRERPHASRAPLHPEPSRLSRGRTCLADSSDMSATRVAQIASERDRVTAAVAELGLAVPQSQANFFWLPLGERSDAFAAICAAHGVSVRCFSAEGVRITVGLPADNDAVLEAASDFVGRTPR